MRSLWRTFRTPHGRWSRWHRDPDTQLPNGRIEREVNRAIQRPGKRALSHQRNEAPISCESDPGRILTLHHPLRFSMPASERTLYQLQGRSGARDSRGNTTHYYYTIRTDRRSQCRQAIDPCDSVARRHTVRESSVQDKLMPVTLSISQRNGASYSGLSHVGVLIHTIHTHPAAHQQFHTLRYQRRLPLSL